MVDPDTKGFIKNKVAEILTPPKKLGVAEWMKDNFHFPSDTAEPGLYDIERAPYQIGVLDAASPQSAVKDIVLAWGAQLGKTTCEIGIKLYYIANRPRPIGFAFSDEGELKSYVKLKFNPFIQANPKIQALLGKGSRNSGDTLTEKQFPGGFLRFIAANVEKNMRSYSLAICIVDEVDALPMDVGGNGSPIGQLRKRMNVFEDSRKFILSSTPGNNDSMILNELASSNYQKYFFKCPHCGAEITFEMESFRWQTDESGKVVQDAWFVCPECNGKITASQKPDLLKSENGAHWKVTNPDAPPTKAGFYLPSFYAPAGWLSWLSIAQEWVDACNARPEQVIPLKVAFYNTNLARQYKEETETPEPLKIMSKAVKASLYSRGNVPEWCAVLTSGADVQGNRIEVEIMGWGKRGRSAVIDHIILPLGPGEDMSDVNSSPWLLYIDQIVHGMWTREDGFVMTPLYNAIDRSYVSNTVDSFYLKNQDTRICPIRGVAGIPKTRSPVPARKENKTIRGAVYFDTPVDLLKETLYGNLLRDDEDGETFGVVKFPRDLPEEYYLQLISEKQEYNPKAKRMEWVKVRDRNEILDITVYNLAMYYYGKFDTFTDDDWQTVLTEQKKQVTAQKSARKIARAQKTRKVFDAGIV